MRHVVVLVAALTGCVHTPPLKLSWDEFPVRVALSGDLSDCQVSAMHAGAELLERRVGIQLFEFEFVPSDHLFVNGLPAFRVIGVAPGDLSSPLALDDTRQSYDAADGRMHSADIRMGPDCSSRAAAHELAHALGLPHSGAGLMREAHDASETALTDEQVEAILVGTVTRKQLPDPTVTRSTEVSTRY